MLRFFAIAITQTAVIVDDEYECPRASVYQESLFFGRYEDNYDIIRTIVHIERVLLSLPKSLLRIILFQFSVSMIGPKHRYLTANG